MPLLTTLEAFHVSDSFLASLYGDDIFKQWRDLKDEMKFVTERDYVSWLINVARSYYRESGDFVETLQENAVRFDAGVKQQRAKDDDKHPYDMEVTTATRGVVKKEQTKTTYTQWKPYTNTTSLCIKQEGESGSQAEQGGENNGVAASSNADDDISNRNTVEDTSHTAEDLATIVNITAHGAIVDNVSSDYVDTMSGEVSLVDEDILVVGGNSSNLLPDIIDDSANDVMDSCDLAPSSNITRRLHPTPRATSRLIKTSVTQIRETPSNTSAKKYQCPHCNYGSDRKDLVSKHTQAIHEHVRPFACSYCDYHSSQKIHLNRHLINKHGFQSNFGCRKCGKYFVSQSLLDKHATLCILQQGDQG